MRTEESQKHLFDPFGFILAMRKILKIPTGALTLSKGLKVIFITEVV